jgi:hypothetical protein
MPFKSKKQRRWMWANEPEMAKKWSDEEKQAKRKEGKTLKITKRKLQQIIQEELRLLNETVSPTKVANLLSAMRAIAYDMDDPEWAAEFLRGEVDGFIAEELNLGAPAALEALEEFDRVVQRELEEYEGPRGLSAEEIVDDMIGSLFRDSDFYKRALNDLPSPKLRTRAIGIAQDLGFD